MAHILIVEDERPIAQSIAWNLKREGYEVVVAGDGVGGLEAALAVPSPALVILDVMLPGMSGMDVCRELRRQQRRWVPVIMLTARTEELDRVTGLEIGADDYLTKPFAMRELIARVRAALRRPAPDAPVESASRHGVTVDFDRHEASVDGVALSLPPKEFDVLGLLIRNAGRALTREDILNAVWGEEGQYRDPHTVDVHVRWLREKVERDPSRPERLLTVRGVGYKFAE